MIDLLEKAIAAHGGWERWQRAKTLTATASIGGSIWPLKGQGGVLDNVRITADPHRQYVAYAPFGAPERHSAYQPGWTSIKTDDGTVLEERHAPRSTFKDHTIQTPWNDHHLIYFSGYAMWTYLTTPFLFRLQGFKVEEIEPWSEAGEEWRRLRVVFPAIVHSHSAEQIFYFDADGILRRHDYSVDVLGGTSSANYATEPKEFDGLVFPTKRRVYARGPDNHPIRERVAVAIDFHDMKVA